MIMLGYSGLGAANGFHRMPTLMGSSISNTAIFVLLAGVAILGGMGYISKKQREERRWR